MNKKMKKIKDDIYLGPEEHDSTLIWLHGLGDTAEGWRDLFQSQLLPSLSNTKIILLTAPSQSVTINNHITMPSWYDILSLETSTHNVKPYNQQQVQQSQTRIQNMIDHEIQYISSQRLMIGGFSQGAAMSLAVGLESSVKIAGIASFSGYLFPHVVENDINKDTEILVYHGLEDEVVQWKYAQQSYQKIQYCSRLQVHTSPYMGHTIDMKGIELLNTFVRKALKVIK